MATILSPALPVEEGPELHSGDRMTQGEFHRIYAQMPPDFKAELVGGVVYVSSPLKRRHGVDHARLSSLFVIYENNTTGVEAGDNATVLLGEEAEPQPDSYLRVLEQYGGQSRVTDEDYVFGAPELLAEVAFSSRSIDLHDKREDYARYGVLEYVVVCLRERQLRWFDLRTGQERPLDPDGVCRIQTFPGLWIHAAALFGGDLRRLHATLQEGLSSAEHEAFTRELARRVTGDASS